MLKWVAIRAQKCSAKSMQRFRIDYVLTKAEIRQCLRTISLRFFYILKRQPSSTTTAMQVMQYHLVLRNECGSKDMSIDIASGLSFVPMRFPVFSSVLIILLPS